MRQDNIDLLALFYNLYGAFQIVALALFGLMFGGFGMLPILLGRTTEDTLIGSAFIGFAALFVVLASLFTLPCFAAAWGLKRRANWARILAILLSVFNLMNMPLGTALGVFSFVVLLKDENAKQFQ